MTKKINFRGEIVGLKKFVRFGDKYNLKAIHIYIKKQNNFIDDRPISTENKDLGNRASPVNRAFMNRLIWVLEDAPCGLNLSSDH